MCWPTLIHFNSFENLLMIFSTLSGTVGPISIGMNGIGIKLYSGGIFNFPSCEKMLNHAVLAVGYDTVEDLDYWIVKNSWGPNWGEHGFFRIARNQNQQCGISLENMFPNLA